MEWTKFQPVVLIPAPSVPNSSQSITDQIMAMMRVSLVKGLLPGPGHSL